MDMPKITSGLSRLFHEEGNRVVFWHDPDQEFEDSLPSLNLDDVTVLRLDECGALEAKLRIERGNPTDCYLLYAPFDPPDPEHDWLLDIRLYGRSFRADKASIILDELGLSHHFLREHLALRAKFLANKDRVGRLKRLVSSADLESDLDRKMIAVLARAEHPDIANIIVVLFEAMANEDKATLDSLPPTWDEIKKYGLAESFWQFVHDAFGYSEDPPSLRNLLIRLMVTDFVEALDRVENAPASLLHLVLPPGSASANAKVCLAQWRDSSTHGESYDTLSAQIADAVKIKKRYRCT